MTDTRKQIIELIEPYMDKTEQHNFLFRDKEWNIREMNQYMFIAWDGVYIERAWYNEPRLFCNIKEIIWHYDITAVLKYIDNICWDKWGFHFENAGCITIWKNKIEWTYDAEVMEKIPLKPLHLYTEQEDKNLLELLKKLWRTQTE